MTWLQTNAIALYAAVVATLGMGIQVQRWFESEARLRITVICPAVQFGGGRKDDREYVGVTVTNRGDMATSITHFTLHEYPNMWARLRRRGGWNAIVPTQQNPQLDLPHHLEAGKYWIGMALYNGKVKEAAERGTLYIGISAVHYRKMILVEVRPAKDRALESATKTPAG